jgi:hypothetical protein
MRWPRNCFAQWASSVYLREFISESAAVDTAFLHYCTTTNHPMSRFNIDITDKQHQSLKALAALEGKTIKQYVLEKLLPESDEDRAWQELKTVLGTRIREGLAGSVSSSSIVEVLDSSPND